MRVLVACEFSGTVRDAFARAGHDAMSVDLLPSETFGKHYQGDVAHIIHDGWDLMIAHPPCTYLASSGARWWPQRRSKQQEAVEFVASLVQSDIPRIALENPIGRLSSVWRRPDQIIQPWQFGHPEWKSTCLWLKGLPLLLPTNIVEPDMTVGGGAKPGRLSSRIHRMPPGPNRQKERSRTYRGIAEAMAAQWGSITSDGGQRG